MTDMEKHHRYSPSSLHRRSLCPASAGMEAMCPEEGGSAAAERGTAIHRALADWLGWCLADSRRPSFPDDADAQMTCEAIMEFAEGIVRGGVPPYELRAEMRLQLRDTFGEVLTEGTADLVWQDTEGLWHVADWKTGRTPVPEAASNWQASAYAAALAQQSRADRVCVHIVQPPLGLSTSREFGGEELAEVASAIMEVVAEGEATGAPCRPSPEACRFCRARLVCTAWRLAQDNALRVPAGLEVARMDDELLAAEYGRVQVAEAYASALREELERRCDARRGEVGGYVLRERAGAQVIGDAELVAEVAESLGLGRERVLSLASLSLTSLARACWEQARASDPKATLTRTRAQLTEALEGVGALERRAPTRTLAKSPAREG